MAHHDKKFLSVPFEKLLLYVEGLILDKNLITRQMQEHTKAHALPVRERELAFVSLYLSLEDVIVSHQPPAITEPFSRESLRLSIAEHISLEGIPEGLRLIFMDEVKQSLYLYGLATEKMLRSIILLAGIDGTREMLEKTAEGKVVSNALSRDGDLDNDALYRYIADKKVNDVEAFDVISFFEPLYSMLHAEVISLFGDGVFEQFVYETFEFIRSQYNEFFVTLFLKIVPEPILQNKKFLTVSKDDLQKKVSGQAQKLDDTMRALVKRNSELSKIRGELEKRLTELHHTAESLVENDKKLRKSTETTQLLLQSIDEGIVATDTLGNVTLVNESAQRMIGWNEQEILGKPWSDLVGVEKIEGQVLLPQDLPIFQVLEKSVSIPYSEYYFLRKDGTKFPVVLTASPIMDGTLVGAVISFRDFTKEKEIERTKSTFVSVAAHQLRTPITAISLTSELLLSGKLGKIDDFTKERIRDISINNDRMVSVVETLLNVSRIELGTLKSNPEYLVITELTDSLIEKFAEKISQKQLHVERRYMSGLPSVYMDKPRFSLIFENVFTNAVTYTKPKDTITLTVEANETDLIMEIADSGYGIPKEDQPRVFSQLFRGSNAAQIDTEGIGMGLHVAKLVIERYRGKIWFESKEGVGTTFYISFPLIALQKK